VVLRCDVRAASAASDLSLPTSDPLTEVSDAIDFMTDQAERFAAAGLPVGDWAFLPAYLVPARASVMVHARPGGQRVRLDALWGFPDGVGLLPHDTWFRDMASGRLTERVQHKGSCLAYDRVDGWQFQPVPAPHDWGHVLNEPEAATASIWAWRVADHLQREVQLMVLIRIGGRRGPEAMIPWHFTDHVVPGSAAAVRRAPGRGVMRVSCPDDLPGEVPPRITGFSLLPTVRARRDADFLTRLGTMAARNNIPVYFEGSVLGHPFYLLRSAGATVVPVGADEPRAVQNDYDKLVRDRIPEIARRGGSAVRVMAASAIDAGRLLRHKLVEEAFEVLESDDDRLTDELADLIEVVRAFGVHTHATADRIEAARAAKAASHGSFDDLVYLESTESSQPLGNVSMERSTLFDEGWAATRAAARNEAGAVAVDRTDERTVVLSVPLVPPLRSGVPLRQYDVQIGEVRITFTHRGPNLTIRIEQLESRPVAGQLSFAVESP
jgi:predicted house-cleaning noncanonical NTP pyrophosphatase (MazG superfamily)